MAWKLDVLVACLALAVGAGCGLFRSQPPPPAPVSAPAPTPPPPPAEPPATVPLDVVVIAAAWLNPDEQGQSLPTVVRIYQLKATSKLEAAEFQQLYAHPKETLGEDLLRSDEIVISPGETAHRRIERERSAKALAVVSMVRRPAGLSWRTDVELPPPDKGAELTFVVEGFRVERR